ncbi:MAG: alanine racemase [Bacillota bacterium]|nr:alanine racemase [Bacillota bacterium]
MIKNYDEYHGIRPAWAEIDLAALRYNARLVRERVGGRRRVMAVIKSNAYGHGAVQAARTLLDAGVDRLAVATVDEAVELRRAGVIAPLMTLGYTPPQQMEMALHYDLISTVFSLELAQRLNDAAARLDKTAVVHIKLDSGMRRLGFNADDDGLRQVRQVCRLPRLRAEGLFSHFADADSADKSYTLRQLQVFDDFIMRARALGMEFAICHIANSAAVCDLPDSWYQMVRPGIMLYGAQPSAQVQRLPLRAVMSVRAEISQLRRVNAGDSLSYGRAWRAGRPSLIATLPLGYADGVLRAFGNRGRMLLHGQYAPIVGRVCMDQLMLDISDIEGVQANDIATLLGADGGALIGIDELAAVANTINYEMFCLLGLRLPKIYIDGGSRQ